MRLRTLLRKLGLSLGVLVALLVAAELVARWAEPGPMSLFDHSPYVPDEQLSYVQRPGFSGRWDSSWYDIESHGWRGPEQDPTFEQGELRVVALGDSCTFGKGVVDADSWPRQLETLLRAELGPERQPKVFNLGVNGYSLWQYERVLEAAAPALKPQLVIIGYNVNDYDSVASQADKLVFSTPAKRKQALEAAKQAAQEAAAQQAPKPSHAAQPASSPPQSAASTPSPAAAKPPAGGSPDPAVAGKPSPSLRARLRAILPKSLRDSLNRSALYRYLRATYYERSRERDYQRIAEIVHQLSSQDAAQRERALEHEAGYLGRLVEASRASGAEVVIFLFPFEAMVVVDGFDREPELFVRDLAQREGVDFVDMPEAFRRQLEQAGGGVRLFIRGDRYHPNSAGYAVVARTLLEHLRQRGLLEPHQ